jgi:hypothetical protein
VSVRDESLTSSQTSGALTTGMLMGEVVAVVSSHHETTDNDDDEEFYKRHVMGGSNRDNPTRSGRHSNSSSLRSSNVGTNESGLPLQLRPVLLPENLESEQSVSILTEHTSLFSSPPNQGSTEPTTIANDDSGTLPLPNQAAKDPPTTASNKSNVPPRRNSRRLWWIVIGATVLVAGVVSGICGSGHCGGGGNGSAKASATSKAIPSPSVSTSSGPSLSPLLGTASPQIDPSHREPDSGQFSHSRTLDAIQRRGALRCGIPDGIELDKIDNGPSLVRFNVDLVRERRNCCCGCDKTPPPLPESNGIFLSVQSYRGSHFWFGQQPVQSDIGHSFKTVCQSRQWCCRSAS